MKILLYSPANARAVDQQSQAILFKQMGHETILLTWMPVATLHENFIAAGASAYSSDVKGRHIFFFIRQIRFLARFCRQHDIDIIFSNGQGCAVATGIAKWFIKISTVYVRHNSVIYSDTNTMKDKLMNWLANKLSPHIMAISAMVKEQLLKENVPEKKIDCINLCYDPLQYKNDSGGKEAAIRNIYKADLMILYIARLVPMKRHVLAFEAIKKLTVDGIDCKLICIGEGNHKNNLQEWIKENDLANKIILAGWVANVFDYIKASDLVMLLSSSEASSHIVKEAAFCNKTVLVCRGVGDFETIIKPGYNGFLVNRDNPVEETVDILRSIAENKNSLTPRAANLLTTVNENFSMQSVRPQYEQLFSLLLSKK